MAKIAALPPSDIPGSAAGPIIKMLPLFAAYVGESPIERAVIAGFDRHGCLRCFAEVAGEATKVANILPAIRTILAENTVTEMIMAHNHPAASSTPSARDRLTTDRLTALARLAGAMLVDHLVFGNDGVFSLAADRRIAGSRGIDARAKRNWSGKEDSNLRPLPPEDSALPG